MKLVYLNPGVELLLPSLFPNKLIVFKSTKNLLKKYTIDNSDFHITFIEI